MKENTPERVDAPARDGGTEPETDTAAKDARDSPKDARDIANDDFCCDYLKSHGVSLDYARGCGLKAVPDGWNKKKSRPIVGGLLIPYYEKLFRLRRRRTRIQAEEQGGTVVCDGYDIPKFHMPAGTEVAPYLPPVGMPQDWATDTKIDLCFAEGPIKALCLTEHGFPCIGLGGVEAGFHDVTVKRSEGVLELHDRLRTIAWRGRTVFIVYDAFRMRNPAVARGEARLAHMLGKQGAVVSLVELPADSRLGKDVASYLDDEKDQGPDDFIVRQGRRYQDYMQTRGAKRGLSRRALIEAASGMTQDKNVAVAATDGAEAGLRYRGGRRAFRALVAAAVPADPVERVRSCCDADGARHLLDDLTLQAALLVGGPTSVAAVVSVLKRQFKLDIGKTAIGEKVREFQDRDARKAAAVAEEAGVPNIQANEYAERSGNTCLIVLNPALGNQYKQVANFTAKITREVAQDDGVTCSKSFTVTGQLASGALLPTIEVPAAKWNERTWVTEHWGSRAVVEAGRDSWGHVLAAVQKSSAPVTVTVYTHTGWRKIGDRTVYLFPDSSVGVVDVDVRNPDDGSRYGFPTREATQEALLHAIRRSLALMTIGPPEVTVPIMAAVYAAPLASILEIDFAVWAAGESGSCKSGFAGLALCHFGRFGHSSLPMAFTSTVNAIEALLFRVKDALVVIDNYVPGMDRDGVIKANRIIQQIGDRGSRGRLNKDSTAMPSRPPRGLVLATGEDIPMGSSDSTVGRLVVVRMRKDDAFIKKVIDASQESGDYGIAMRAYLEWLASDYETRTAEVRRHRDQLVPQFQAVVREHAAHPRTARSVATLGAGLATFLRFALEAGAITQDEQEHVRESADRALDQVARQQGSFRENSTPAQKYITAVRALLLQGRATLAERYADLDAEKGIGWEADDKFVYLHPDLAWKAIEEFHAHGQQKWPYTKVQMHHALIDTGVVHRGEVGKADTKRTVGVGHASIRVLMVNREQLADALPARVDYGEFVADDADDAESPVH